MQFWIKVMIAVGVLLGAGGLIRLLTPGSANYDVGETVGMLLIAALLVAIGTYVLQFRKPPSVVEAESDTKATGTRKSFSMPIWAVLALLFSGIGASSSQHGAVAFLLAFAVFGLVFWLIERAIKAIWRRSRSGRSDS